MGGRDAHSRDSPDGCNESSVASNVASEAAFQWMASDNPMRQLYGFLIMARLLQAGGQLNERSIAELRDQASSSLPDADLNLRKAIHSVLDRLK